VPVLRVLASNKEEVMKKYEISGAQRTNLDRAFQMIPARDGWPEKFEMINTLHMQLAQKMFTITPPGEEQMEGLKKIREAMSWFKKAIETHEL
jgi:hypothetical protein